MNTTAVVPIQSGSMTTESVDLSASDLVVRRGRSALHELAQAVTLVVGAIELLDLMGDNPDIRGKLLPELQEGAQLLVERTERLRSVLHGATGT
ncbi:MAG: hypothetical protein HY329_01785 [Chloroflexi bacterium]|nr:hypothetical protein [Chloroflexota bacterium]